MRFNFGKNWSNFIKHLDGERIFKAIESLKIMLNVSSLSGQCFLDIGSGSGLFSYAAHSLGADVRSFDYDLDSVACTSALKERFAATSSRWKIEQGSVLDRKYLDSLGTFDIVYSWGVLHHTGEMWKAIENASLLVRKGGKFYISIYNDQGLLSKYWSAVKKLYNRSNSIIKYTLLIFIGAWFEILRCIKRCLQFKNPLPWVAWREKKQDRGMSYWYDLVDWIGGYPFEVAKPEEIIDFLQSHGFRLLKLKTVAGGHGCCEYLFLKEQ